MSPRANRSDQRPETGDLRPETTARTKTSPVSCLLSPVWTGGLPGERGIALLIVVSVLTVVAIMGVSFVFSMFLETQASRQFVVSTQARYVAEAGINHGWVVLDEDRLGSRYDDLTEAWVDAMTGSDTDVDGDSTLDARWWLMADDHGEVVGRYGVRITDEAGKANLNIALADPVAHGVDGVDLASLLSRAEVPNAASLASAIEGFRYGEDGEPGLAGVDDDGDGEVDEPDEYQSRALRGDDQRFENLEEVLQLAELDAEAFRKLGAVATVYSWDANLSVTGQPRLNVNTATAEEILVALLEKGGENPWQLAANMADYVDADLALSKVVRHSTLYEISNQGTQGGWEWQLEPVGHYLSTASETPLAWTLSVPPGTCRVLVRGLPGTKVGDVTIAEELRPSMDAGETFGTLELASGTMTVEVACQEPQGVSCAFRGVELVPTEPPTSGGTVVRGIEAVRFNELMVSPTAEYAVSAATFSRGNSDWSCDGAMCTNTGVGTATWEWRTRAGQSNYAPPGKYHLRVYGQLGSAVGKVNSGSAVLFHGQRHDATLIVVEVPQADEQQPKQTKFSVAIGKAAGDSTYYFQNASLSLEPDGEYVELINLSGEPIDASGWIVEGVAAGGRTASLPEDSTIPAHGVLVAAVDVDDTQPGLENDITARAAWDLPDDANIVQLQFLEEEGSLSPDMDWLISTLPPDATSARLALKDRYGWLVDELEYPIPPPTSIAFQSLEKGDPTVVLDEDDDGLDEDWYPSLKQYTPAAPNDNEGLLEAQGGEQIRHDPSTEVEMLNRPLGSLGELAGLPSSTAWQPVASDDLAVVVDQLTVEGLRLESAAATLVGGQDRWHETVSGYETSGSAGQAVGVWEWTGVPDGTYRLSLYGWSGETMAVRWSEEGEWTPGRVTDAQGRLIIGEVSVGMGVADPNTLHLEIRCESESAVCHFLDAMLDPQLVLVGRINVNTASRDVLLSLSGMTEPIVDRIIEGRPYGDQDGKARGIGDVLMGSFLGETEEDKLDRFRQLANWLTVRSQVFQIMSLGEAFEHNHPAASKRIQAILQR